MTQEAHRRGNSSYVQWLGDVLVKNFIFAIAFGHGGQTRFQKPATVNSQTLTFMPLDTVRHIMKQLTVNKLPLTILLVIGGLLETFGQSEVAGKYTGTDYSTSRSYLILNSDKTFKFQYRSHSTWDLACGLFKMKNDTIFFTYTSDMFDLSCNTEKINMTDTSDYFLRTGVDKTYRPVTATIKKKKIQTIKTGDTTDYTTVELRTYSYKRLRKRHER